MDYLDIWNIEHRPFLCQHLPSRSEAICGCIHASSVPIRCGAAAKVRPVLPVPSPSIPVLVFQHSVWPRVLCFGSGFGFCFAQRSRPRYSATQTPPHSACLSIRPAPRPLRCALLRFLCVPFARLAPSALSPPANTLHHPSGVTPPLRQPGSRPRVQAWVPSRICSTATNHALGNSPRTRNPPFDS